MAGDPGVEDPLKPDTLEEMKQESTDTEMIQPSSPVTGNEWLSCQVTNYESCYEQATGSGHELSHLTLARAGGGGWCNLRPPHEFFWNGHRTAGRIAMKFCIAYLTSFVQRLVKTKLTGSGQVTELWRHKRYSLRSIYTACKSCRVHCSCLEIGYETIPTLKRSINSAIAARY